MTKEALFEDLVKRAANAAAADQHAEEKRATMSGDTAATMGADNTVWHQVAGIEGMDICE